MSTGMKLSNGVISRQQAIKISKDFVQYHDGDWDCWESIWEKFQKLKKNQKVLIHHDKQYILGKVSNVDRTSMYAGMGDGLVVRVSNGEYSWRISSGEAYPIS